jgi:hypothetical protein
MQGRGKALTLMVLGSIAAWTILGAQCAGAKPPIPAYAARLAGDTFDGGVWSIWVFGHHDSDQCWATKIVEDRSGNENALCGFSVPARPWQFAAKGTFGTGRDQESMLFFLTRESIISLKVRVGKEHDQQSWAQLPTRRLTAKAAQGAQIKKNFSYAAGTIPGPLRCVGRIIATTRSGKKIARSPNSCGSHPGSQ